MAATLLQKKFQSNAKILSPLQENKINEKNIKLSFSKTALYDAMPFTLYEQKNILQNSASSFFIIGSADYPVHDSFLISIKNQFTK